MEELTVLAMSGATTVLGLVVSDLWEQAKERNWRLFRRRGSDVPADGETGDDTGRDTGQDAERVVAEVEAAGREVATARAAGDETTAAAIEERWRERLSGRSWTTRPP